jgi:hypothetical protein
MWLICDNHWIYWSWKVCIIPNYFLTSEMWVSVLLSAKVPWWTSRR